MIVKHAKTRGGTGCKRTGCSGKTKLTLHHELASIDMTKSVTTKTYLLTKLLTQHFLK